MDLLRRLLLAVLAGLLTSACMAAGPEATPIGQPAPGHAAYALGYKGLSSGWSGADDHFVFGLLDGDWRPSGWPVWIAGQMLFSYSDDAPDSAPFYADYGETYEFSLGLRRYTSWGRVEPWVGAGAVLLGGSVVETGDAYGWYWVEELDDDWVWGWYADGGVLVPLNPVFTLGLALRWSDGGSAELLDEDVELGGFSALLLIGARF